MPFGYGSVVTSTALSKEYDRYAEMVLSSKYLKREPKTAKKERTKYSIIEQTPTKEEYIKLKQAKYKTTVRELVSDAFSDISGLADEMQEAFENMPEGLQKGDVRQRREEAASNLQNISEVEIPDEAKEIEIVHYPALDTSSRRKRAEESNLLRDRAHIKRTETDSEMRYDKVWQIDSQLELTRSSIERVEQQLGMNEPKGASHV